MILNVSGRTDIVSHYSDWLFNRLDAGWAYSRNSLFPNSVRRYELTPAKVDCIVFGSKDYSPVLGRIRRFTERFNTYFNYTITAYGKDVEPGVPGVDESAECLLELSRIVGSRRLAWRYDPVLLTERYTIERHLETFERLCSRLAGSIDRCIFSFVEMYAKHGRNLPELRTMLDADKDALASGMGGIASHYGITLQTCGPEGDYVHYGIQTSGCVTLDILGRANDVRFRNLKHKGFREGCHCIESRDLGALNSCTSGCRYCYANRDAASAAANSRRHDPRSPLLIGDVLPADDVQPGAQRSFLCVGG
jgi:hypothetical protein